MGIVQSKILIITSEHVDQDMRKTLWSLAFLSQTPQGILGSVDFLREKKCNAILKNYAIPFLKKCLNNTTFFLKTLQRSLKNSRRHNILRRMILA